MITFDAVVQQCAATPEFVAEFDRLTGSRLSSIGRRSPLDAMIDGATGWEDEQLRRFCVFVAETVWATLPAPPEARP